MNSVNQRGQALSPGTAIIGFSLIFGTIIMVITGEKYAFIYLIAIPALIISLVNYEWNFAMWLVCVNVAAGYQELMHEYSLMFRWVMLGILASKFALPMIKKGKTVRSRGIQVGFGLFCFFALLSTMGSAAFQTSLYRTISLWLMYFAVFFSLWRYLDSRKKVDRFIRIWIYIAGAFIVVGLVEGLLGYEEAFLWDRLKGLYINPNTLGLLDTMYIPLSFWLIINKQFCHKKRWRWFHCFLFGSAVLSLVLSGSRAAMLGLIAGGIFYLGFRFQRRLIIYFALLATLAGIFSGFVEEITQTTFVQDVLYRKATLEAFGGRKEGWEASLRLYKRNPVLGYGFGTSDIALAAGGDVRKMAEMQSGAQTHNNFLRVLLEMGGVGIAFSALFLISLILSIYRLMKKIPTRELFDLVSIMVTGIIAGIVDSVFESWMLGVGNLFCVPYWAVVMLIYRMNYRVDDYVEKDDTIYEGKGHIFRSIIGK